MFLTLIVPNKSFSIVLERSISFLFKGVKAYSSFDLIPKNNETGITICVLDEVNADAAVNWSQGHKTFALSRVDIEQQEQFSVFLKLPIRLGMLIEIIRHHLNYQEQQNKLKEINMGSLKLIPKNNQLFLGDNKMPIILTEKEQNIFIALYNHSGKIVSRDFLLKNIWGYVEGLETHTLETHIYRLRQKIEANPSEPKILLTEGVGYKLVF